MKLLPLLLLLFFAPQSRERAYYGRVVDARGAGIPYAAIEIVGKNIGYYTDSAGYFHFNGHTDSLRLLRVLSTGYEAKEISTAKLPEDSIRITLKAKQMELPAVNVSSSRKHKKARPHTLGKRKQKQNGAAYYNYGDELCIFLEPEKYRANAYLQHTYVYITKEGHPNSWFRVRVYDIDSGKLFPGFELTQREILARADTGNEWVRIDLAQDSIRVNKGVFIAVEWVKHPENVAQPWQKGELRGYYFSGARYGSGNWFSGQVIGLTWDYGIRALTYVSMHDRKDKWTLLYAPKRKKIFDPDHWINLMVYAKYEVR